MTDKVVNNVDRSFFTSVLVAEKGVQLWHIA
jgi:hypothetical protein